MSILEALASAREKEAEISFGGEVVRFRFRRPCPERFFSQGMNTGTPSSVVAAEMATGQPIETIIAAKVEGMSTVDRVLTFSNSRDRDIMLTVVAVEDYDGWRDIDIVADADEDLPNGKLGINSIPDEARSQMWAYARAVLGRQEVERQLRSFRERRARELAAESGPDRPAVLDATEHAVGAA